MIKIFQQVIVTLLIVTSLLFATSISYADASEDVQRYTREIQLNPNSAEVYYNRGKAYFDLGQYERAIQDFNKAIELNSRNALYYLLRGVAYTNSEQYDNAIEDFNKFIVLTEQKSEVGYYWRGMAYALKKEYVRAISNLNIAIELNPNDAKAYSLRGFCWQKFSGDDNNEKAQADFAKAKELGYEG